MKFWKGENSKNKRVYLDWAAATPLLPEAKAAMESFLTSDFGNPSAVHQEGRVARQAVEGARDSVARALQVKPEFITFTAGGTEGNNIAILGTLKQLRSSDRKGSPLEVITTKIEHPSVLNAMQSLEDEGVIVKYVDVDEEGFVQLGHLEELISENTALVSVAYANSEIGVVQKLHAIKKVMSEAEKQFSTKIYFHVDAAQAPLWLSCQFDTLDADLLVLDAAKCRGPKGVGVLIRSRRVEVRAITFGGGQESGLRSGTENVAGIVGAGVAIVEAQREWRARTEEVSVVRDEGIALLLREHPTAVLNGPSSKYRLANNINISIPVLDTEYAAVWLDERGFAVSTKSACSGAGGGESTVVKVISGDPARAASPLRITLGPDTTMRDIQNLSKALQEYRSMMKNLTQ